MSTCYTDDVVLGSGHTTCSIMLENEKTNLHTTRPHLMLEFPPSNLMWHMMCHLMLSKVVRYHLVWSDLY
jgi:hypothetical protein